jgi:hypothetical protein
MSALSRRTPLQAKIRKQMFVFWNHNFGDIWGRFGDDFGGPKTAFFLHFFRFLGEANFDAFFGTPKKRQKSQKSQSLTLFGPWFPVPGGAWGEKKRGVSRILQIEFCCLSFGIEFL